MILDSLLFNFKPNRLLPPLSNPQKSTLTNEFLDEPEDINGSTHKLIPEWTSPGQLPRGFPKRKTLRLTSKKLFLRKKHSDPVNHVNRRSTTSVAICEQSNHHLSLVSSGTFQPVNNHCTQTVLKKRGNAICQPIIGDQDCNMVNKNLVKPINPALIKRQSSLRIGELIVKADTKSGSLTLNQIKDLKQSHAYHENRNNMWNIHHQKTKSAPLMQEVHQIKAKKNSSHYLRVSRDANGRNVESRSSHSESDGYVKDFNNNTPDNVRGETKGIGHELIKISPKGPMPTESTDRPKLKKSSKTLHSENSVNHMPLENDYEAHCKDDDTYSRVVGVKMVRDSHNTKSITFHKTSEPKQSLQNREDDNHDIYESLIGPKITNDTELSTKKLMPKGNQLSSVAFRETDFQTGIIFEAKFIGSMEVPKPTNRTDIVIAMRKIRFDFKASSIKKKAIKLFISINGISVTYKMPKKKFAKIKNLNTGLIEEQTLFNHPIYRVFYVSHDSQDLKIFSYIARDCGTNNFKCNVFKADKKDEAMLIVRTIGQAFEVCHKFITDSNIQTLNKSKTNYPSSKRSDNISSQPLPSIDSSENPKPLLALLSSGHSRCEKFYDLDYEGDKEENFYATALKGINDENHDDNNMDSLDDNGTNQNNSFDNARDSGINEPMLETFDSMENLGNGYVAPESHTSVCYSTVKPKLLNTDCSTRFNLPRRDGDNVKIDQKYLGCGDLDKNLKTVNSATSYESNLIGSAPKIASSKNQFAACPVEEDQGAFAKNSPESTNSFNIALPTNTGDSRLSAFSISDLSSPNINQICDDLTYKTMCDRCDDSGGSFGVLTSNSLSSPEEFLLGLNWLDFNGTDAHNLLFKDSNLLDLIKLAQNSPESFDHQIPKNVYQTNFLHQKIMLKHYKHKLDIVFSQMGSLKDKLSTADLARKDAEGKMNQLFRQNKELVRQIQELIKIIVETKKEKQTSDFDDKLVNQYQHLHAISSCQSCLAISRFQDLCIHSPRDTLSRTDRLYAHQDCCCSSMNLNGHTQQVSHIKNRNCTSVEPDMIRKGCHTNNQNGKFQNQSLSDKLKYDYDKIFNGYKNNQISELNGQICNELFKSKVNEKKSYLPEGNPYLRDSIEFSKISPNNSLLHNDSKYDHLNPKDPFCFNDSHQTLNLSLSQPQKSFAPKSKNINAISQKIGSPIFYFNEHNLQGQIVQGNKNKIENIPNGSLFDLTNLPESNNTSSANKKFAATTNLNYLLGNLENKNLPKAKLSSSCRINSLTNKTNLTDTEKSYKKFY